MADKLFMVDKGRRGRFAGSSINTEIVTMGGTANLSIGAVSVEGSGMENQHATIIKRGREESEKARGRV